MMWKPGLWNQNRRRNAGIAGFVSTPFVLALAAGLLLAGCGGSGASTVNAKLGEAIALGGIEHTILGAEWRTSIGQGTESRVPSQQFLVLKLAVANKDSATAEIASLRLVAANGQEYEELADGSGLPDWLGLVRSLSPRESRQGTVLFDAPRAVYTLKLTEHTIDGDDANVALVEIPIRMEDSAIPGAADPTATTLP